MKFFLLADVVTRLRNGYLVGKEEVEVYNSKFIRKVLDILISIGYIVSYTFKEGKQFNGIETNVEFLVVKLKYVTKTGKGKIPAVKYIKTLSTPAKRTYIPWGGDLLDTTHKLGLKIISTSQGLKTGYDAFRLKIGGEAILEIF